MSIQSTSTISREDAIKRIKQISNFIINKNYKKLSENTLESEFGIKKFIDNWEPIDLDRLDYWSDSMLEDYIDRPFFRHSLFDNYQIN